MKQIHLNEINSLHEIPQVCNVGRTSETTTTLSRDGFHRKGPRRINNVEGPLNKSLFRFIKIHTSKKLNQTNNNCLY